MDEISVKKNLELNTLIEFSNLINSNLDLKFILNNILLTIMGRMLISKGMFLIKTNEEKNENEFIVEASKGLLPGSNGSVLYFPPPSEPVYVLKDSDDTPDLFTLNRIKYIFKIYFSDKLLGMLCLGAKPGTKALGKNEIVFIETMLNISSTTIENTLKFTEIKKLNNKLNEKIGNLRALFELSKEFNTNFLDKSKIIRLLNYTMLGNYGVKDFLIISKYRAESYYTMINTSKIHIPEIEETDFSKLENPVIIEDGKLVVGNKVIELPDIEIVIPIDGIDKKAETVAFVGRKLNRTKYSKEDIDFIEAILNISVISMENSLLFKESVEKKLMENELKIAREIQLALLPKTIPQTEKYKVCAINNPAMEVGGDYFDILKMNDNSLVFAIGDVSGKGTPAALLMSNLQSAVRSYLKMYDEKFNLSEITVRINNLIYENTTPEKFITFFWGILDTSNNTFSYINAGHNPGYLISKKNVKELNEGGLIIGITSDKFQYETGNVNFEKDNVIVLYTDGITEAKNLEDKEYGTERLLKCIENCLNYVPDKIVECILSDVNNFSVNTPQSDDQTLIVIKRVI